MKHTLIKIEYLILGLGKFVVRNLLLLIGIFLSVISVLIEKLGKFIVGCFIISLFVSAPFKEFILSGEWWQMSIKILLFIAPCFVCKYCFSFITAWCVKTSEYLAY